MFKSWSIIVSAFLLLLTFAQAAIKPYITTAAEYNTECKTCPRSLCPNRLYYSTEDTLNVTCWTRGTKIMGDRLWLKSEAGCYITQYDVLEYAGDCELWKKLISNQLLIASSRYYGLSLLWAEF